MLSRRKKLSEQNKGRRWKCVTFSFWSENIYCIKTHTKDCILLLIVIKALMQWKLLFTEKYITKAIAEDENRMSRWIEYYFFGFTIKEMKIRTPNQYYSYLDSTLHLMRNDECYISFLFPLFMQDLMASFAFSFS